MDHFTFSNNVQRLPENRRKADGGFSYGALRRVSEVNKSDIIRKQVGITIYVLIYPSMEQSQQRTYPT